MDTVELLEEILKAKIKAATQGDVRACIAVMELQDSLISQLLDQSIELQTELMQLKLRIGV